MDNKYDYITDPKGIEVRSFEIITEELGPHEFSDAEALVVKRVIHTTADFEYAEIIEFANGALDKGMAALKAGSDIYCDTRMVMSGINQKRLNDLGGKTYNHVHDEQVAVDAKERGITRSMVGLEKAAFDENTKIFAIGNAPTALFVLIDLIKEGKIKPALVIGAPIGFVGAAESKELLRTLDIPYIAIRGRKGGSPVAATIINAMMYQL